MSYWMACSADKYELPIFIEETVRGLANKIGVTHSAICLALKNESIVDRKYIIRRVKINDN